MNVRTAYAKNSFAQQNEAMPKTARSRRERQKEELRAELLAAAHTLVQEEGYEGLTIRKLAERVGYAPMSVYSYFADKQDILLALAQDAFQELARRIERQEADDPIEALRGVLREYAAFGLENPNEYRTVFMTEKLHLADDKAFMEMEQNNPAMNMLMKRVDACVAAGQLKGDVRAIATMLWTAAHGAIALLITFPLYPFGDPKDYVMRFGELTLAAIAAQDIAPLSDTPATC